MIRSVGAQLVGGVRLREKGGGGEEGGQSSEGENEVKGIMEKQKGLKGQSNERNVKMLQCRDGGKYEEGVGKERQINTWRKRK